MKYCESDEFSKLKRCFENGKISKWDAYDLLKARRKEGCMDSTEFLKCLGILGESVGYFYSEDERVSWYKSCFKDGTTKYSDSTEFKKLWSYFISGKIDKANALDVLNSRHGGGFLSYDEWLKCSEMFQNSSIKSCGTCTANEFLNIARNDMIANFSNRFSDKYILNKIYNSSNPKNYKFQENASIDEQINNLIYNYDCAEKVNKMRREKDDKFWFYVFTAICALSFGVSGYIVADGVDWNDASALFTLLSSGICSGVFAYNKGTMYYDEIFKKKEKKK